MKNYQAYTHRVGCNGKRSSQSTNADHKSIETGFFDCHVSPVGRQMTIEISVSNDFLSMLLDKY